MSNDLGSSGVYERTYYVFPCGGTAKKTPCYTIPAFPSCSPKVAWKRFWLENQRYETVCLECISERKRKDRQRKIEGTALDSAESDSEVDTFTWGPVYLSAASNAIILRWYKEAQRRVWVRSGRPKVPVPVDVSDDEADGLPGPWKLRPVELSDASRALAVRWLRTARARLQQRGVYSRSRAVVGS